MEVYMEGNVRGPFCTTTMTIAGSCCSYLGKADAFSLGY